MLGMDKAQFRDKITPNFESEIFKTKKTGNPF